MAIINAHVHLIDLPSVLAKTGPDFIDYLKQIPAFADLDMAAYPYELRELVTPKIVERVGAHKWLFGTDFPMPYEGQTHRMADFVEVVNGLPLDRHG
ncbi:hypothetical protein [uncultured Thiodictyon sp.]|jgi:hypothetical protein|uniref:hypothetical protein n=1 Tax=uncultured Thiodictyon sp. TaxID=1846217 RepID=UPI0025E354F2|nr:hypothetical protein [uncultured Thiodictyon sp.]